MAEEGRMVMSKLVKRYVWKHTGDSYFNTYSKFPSITGNWGRSVEWETDDMLCAKSWKTLLGSERTLKANIKQEQEFIKNSTDRLNDPNTSNYDKRRYTKNLDEATKQLAVLKSVTVTEIEIDENAKKKSRITFAENSYKGFHSNEKGKGNAYCRICGMRLRDLPYFTIGSNYRKSLNVCPSCILERAQEAEIMLSKLPDDLRKEIVAERFLHNMG